MKNLLLLGLFGFTCVSTMAQNKNRVEVGLLQYQFTLKPAIPSSAFNGTAISLGYERAICNRFGAFIQYSGLTDNSQAMYESQTTYYSGYEYADLGLSYKLLKINRHQLTTRAAFSYAHGNAFIDVSVSDPNPSPDGIVVCYAAPQFRTETKGYFGALAGIRYDYSFWKNRLNAGLNFDARHYASGFPFQVNYGGHLGFNF